MPLRLNVRYVIRQETLAGRIPAGEKRRKRPNWGPPDLVPMKGSVGPKEKQSYAIALADGLVIALAGLCEN